MRGNPASLPRSATDAWEPWKTDITKVGPVRHRLSTW